MFIATALTKFDKSKLTKKLKQNIGIPIMLLRSFNLFDV